MSLSQALSIAMSGLRANQLALSLTSSNVANSDTPGYIRKTVNQIQTSSGSIGAGVSVTGVNRELDLYLQQQIRTEQSGAAITGASGSISGSSLEGSNTDIADEFTKLIVTQQAYSANTRVISTTNQMVQDLLNMLR